MRVCTFIIALFIALIASTAEAATLSVTPASGVYPIGTTFTVKVVLNTTGKTINAAEGSLLFNPAELMVINVDRGASVFNLWVTEPVFSNTKGTISFSGGSPSGYTGSNGTVFTVTFRALTENSARLRYESGAILANDGMGTNILTGMSGGTYTLQAKSTVPEVERIEYIASPNTPSAPRVVSSTHKNQEGWYTTNKAELSWEIPSGVIAVRTLLDDQSTSIPTKEYATPITTITLDDLPEGVSYFHIQFKNEVGWGRVTHYRLARDTVAPADFSISLPTDANLEQGTQEIVTQLDETQSGIKEFRLQINDMTPIIIATSATNTRLPLPALSPGTYTVVAQAVDHADNTSLATVVFTIQSFSAPVWSLLPDVVAEKTLVVIRGTTRSEAYVDISFTKLGYTPQDIRVQADQDGVFTFIPDKELDVGTYELVAKASLADGSQSQPTTPVRFVVEKIGYLRFGETLISAISIIITLVSLTLLLFVLSSYTVRYVRRLKKLVQKESLEIDSRVKEEFTLLTDRLAAMEDAFRSSKRTKKLSEQDEALFTSYANYLKESEKRIMKEVEDIEELSTTTHHK